MPDLAISLETAWRKQLESRRWDSTKPRDYVYASQRRSCVRCMALDLMHPEDRPPIDADGLERMERGKEREAAIIARLMKIGPRHDPAFEVIEGQKRFEVTDRDGTVLIVGKVDGVLRLEDGRKVVFECKSGRTFARVRVLEDLQDSIWTRHALDQLLVYLLAMGEPEGLFILDGDGVPRFLTVRLEDHLERAEAFLREARQAVDARFGRGPLPDIPDDRSWCKHCPHLGKTCAPPDWSFGPGAELIDDPALAEALARRAELEPCAREFRKIDGQVKERLKGVELAICGGFELRGKWVSRTTYDVPKEIKDQYKRVDPQAAFRLEIRPIGG